MENASASAEDIARKYGPPELNIPQPKIENFPSAPPPELNVIQPKIEYFMDLARQELIRQNGVTAVTKTSFDLPCTDTDYSKKLKCEADKAPTLKSSEHMSDLGYCSPKIDGPISFADAGKYHKIGNDIFYVFKVKASGLDGVYENGACVTKTSVAPLTATVHLMWSNSTGAKGWQGSSNGEIRSHKSEARKDARLLRAQGGGRRIPKARGWT